MDTIKIAQAYADALAEKFTRQADEAADRVASSYRPRYSFDLEVGQKFIRLVMRTDKSYGSSVHAFVERSTGKLIKAASWKAPAKDKDGLAYRYDLTTPQGFAEALAHATFSGGYLYADFVRGAGREDMNAALDAANDFFDLQEA